MARLADLRPGPSSRKDRSAKVEGWVTSGALRHPFLLPDAASPAAVRGTPLKVEHDRVSAGRILAAYHRGLTLLPQTHLSRMVGPAGIEPATPCSQSRCATRLRYSPVVLCRWVHHDGDAPDGDWPCAGVTARPGAARRVCVLLL